MRNSIHIQSCLADIVYLSRDAFDGKIVDLHSPATFLSNQSLPILLGNNTLASIKHSTLAEYISGETDVIHFPHLTRGFVF